MISLFGSNVDTQELDSLKDCFDRQWLGVGPKTTEFETAMAQKLSTQGFVFVNSGSNALHLAVRLLNLPQGSEVILPSFNWISCGSAIVLNGLKPVFCDVDLDTCNVTAEHVEQKITPNTKAIMVVHYAGKPVDMDSLAPFGLPIVEDAAHAIDSSYRAKACGTLGAAGIFSFDAVKNLTTGEGGGVVTQDPKLLQAARNLRYCGIAKSGFDASIAKTRWWEYDVHDFFPKMLNSDVAAAIGLAQLKKLPSFQERRKEIWDTYTQVFSQESWANNWLEIPTGPGKHEKHSYFTYVIRLRTGSRDKLARFLFDRGIYTSLRYHPLHLNKIYGDQEDLPNSEKLNEIALNIPLHQRLTHSDIDQILDGLKAFRQQHI
jgi:dTDP-4-amino-4,6-dideoxygalactose transaminase